MQVLDMAPLPVKGLKIAANAHGERNLIGQMTIDMPSIGNIAIIDFKHVYRCCLDGRSKPKSSRSGVLRKLQSEFHGAES